MSVGISWKTLDYWILNGKSDLGMSAALELYPYTMNSKFSIGFDDVKSVKNSAIYSRYHWNKDVDVIV